ncbi:hypothetical protein FB561_1012 [Kribbella amoyensis]|uniref:Uncharacterized protein n=1 Tax=Kribbella amoyensis TaxID=996641 RepID=A0A561BM22_9ACTN|nr:hypothetical protein [Kribbella amoyensis]TWD79946.1 hypothetical protein FB561_1012 [Kribbella amoyensis]
MTTIARTSTAPAWAASVPRAALLWSAVYGGVRLWFATGHGPDWKLPGNDLLVPDWVAVAGCALSAAGLVTLAKRPRSRVLIGLVWAMAAGWVAVSALALLDVVGGILPGLGIPFDLAGLLSRFGALTGAALLGLTALTRQRALDPTCLRCSGQPHLTSTPRWAFAAAWLAVAGCLTRLAAQAVVGFDFVPYDAGLSILLFEGGFLLAGILLPLLLVYRAGRVFPRWMLLLPGAGLGAGITAYFGVGLLQMIAAALQGKAVYGDVGLPDSFFWVAVPAYFAWGVGLAVAAYGYHLRTRRPCKGCGR